MGTSTSSTSTAATFSLEDRDLTKVEFIDDDSRMLVSSSVGPVEVVTLDHGELVDIARSRITEDECDLYRLRRPARRCRSSTMVEPTDKTGKEGTAQQPTGRHAVFPECS